MKLWARMLLTTLLLGAIWFSFRPNLEEPQSHVAHGVTLEGKEIGGYDLRELQAYLQAVAVRIDRAALPPQLDPRTGGVIPGLAGTEVDISATITACLRAKPRQAVALAMRWVMPELPLRDKPIFQGNGAKRQVAFVVNVAWGNSELLEILDLFSEHNLTKTFFLVGRWADKFPELVREISHRGHEFGNHAYSDAHLPKLSDEAIREEIRRTTAAIARAVGDVPVRFFSPPYNDFDARVVRIAAELGYTTVLSSVDTADWMRPGVDRIVRRVLSKVHNGAIVLMHPTEQTPGALVDLIPSLTRQGFALVPVSVMLCALPTEERLEGLP